MIVTHSRGSYPIDFCCFDEIEAQLPEHAFVITDENVNRHWKLPRPTLVLPAGEESKSIERFELSIRWLANQNARRNATVVALGGGVIGDLAGYVAASYMRGVPFIQIPTTLLAQVDSSVGGKVGIDLPEGKNLVGAFLPPTKVLIALETLQTLTERQLRNGMAEVCKYGFILDPSLLDLIAQHPSDLKTLIEKCIELKAKVVQEDEYETTGLRAILNFGHTIGHAIEQLTGYGPILHGEAISIGMVVEAKLGERLGVTEQGTAQKVEEILTRQGLPTNDPVLKNGGEMIAVMRKDKKVTGASLAFSLLTAVGTCKLMKEISESEVKNLLETLS